MQRTIIKKCRKGRCLNMEKMQTEVMDRQCEENEIVTEKLCSSRESGVKKMTSLVGDDACGGNYPVAMG